MPVERFGHNVTGNRRRDESLDAARMEYGVRAPQNPRGPLVVTEKTGEELPRDVETDLGPYGRSQTASRMAGPAL